MAGKETGIITSLEVVKDIDLLIHSIDKNQLLDEYQKDEIRDHLMEEIGTLKLKGLSEKESFLVASHRFGPLPLLIEEYGKAQSRYFNLKDLTHFSLLILYGLLGFYLCNIILLWFVNIIIQFSLPKYFVFVFGTVSFVAFISYFYYIFKKILRNSFKTIETIITLVVCSLGIIGMVSISRFMPHSGYLEYMDYYRLMSNLELIFIMVSTVSLAVTQIVRTNLRSRFQEEFV